MTKTKYFCVLLLTVHLSLSQTIYSNDFAVQISSSWNISEIAFYHGFEYVSPIFENYHLFRHPSLVKRSTESLVGSSFSNDDRIDWFEQQREYKRVKRNVPTDPYYEKQWYLHSGAKGGYDMNVERVWKDFGMSGKGIVVSILDDGLQINHPDLSSNYDPLASTDINGNDDDPTPLDNSENKHGTRCAGEVAAVAFNEFCGVGIAYSASIGGVRMLDGLVNDAVEAKALSLNPQHIDIYSASWGPEDDGKTVDGPGHLAKEAFLHGVSKGRSGKGSIFIWASGNGGRRQDDCNCDGYTNSLYTISFSSATQSGRQPWYLEKCSSTLSTTYSSGTPGIDASITTTDADAQMRKDKLCTFSHTGTSASAPIAAGVTALALEANSNLTWRDMQYLVIASSNPKPLLDEKGWLMNGVGRLYSHKFGYGLMDARALVALALNWKNVGSQNSFSSFLVLSNSELYSNDSHLLFSQTLIISSHEDKVKYLEHVILKLSLVFTPRGSLEILLISPSGTRSILLHPRPFDTKSEGRFDDWPFLSVHFWGESPVGNWTLEIRRSSSSLSAQERGTLLKWQLIFYGVKKKSLFSSSKFKTNSRSETKKEFFERSLENCSTNEYLSANQNCELCHKSCSSCYGPSNQECLSCFFPLSLSGSTCVSLCSPPSTSRLGLCQSCLNPSCDLCNGSHCLSCFPPLLLYQNDCYDSCPTGTYSSSDSRTCEPCHYSCESCRGPLASDCEVCNSNYYFHESLCLDSCPNGFTSQGKAKFCFPCSRGCDFCNETSCLSCKAPEWSLDFESGKCWLEAQKSKCRFPCLSCIHQTCLRCAAPEFHLYNGTCVKDCPDFTFDNYNECQHCFHSCSSCKSSLSCTSCKDNYFFHKDRCLLYCPSNTYVYNSSCIDCSSNCKRCSFSFNKCLSCHESLFLWNYTCVNNCPKGFRNDSGFCVPCHASCGSCSGSGSKNCLSCSSGHQLNKGSCLSCGLSMSYNGSICVGKFKEFTSIKRSLSENMRRVNSVSLILFLSLFSLGILTIYYIRKIRKAKRILEYGNSHVEYHKVPLYGNDEEL